MQQTGACVISQLTTPSRQRLPLPLFRTSIKAFLARTLSGALLLLSLTTGHVDAFNAPTGVFPQTAVQDQAAGLPTLSDGEYELKSTEAHSYRVSLSAGEYFYALVRPKGIDVDVTVFTPENEKLFVSNSPNPWEEEPVLFVAAVGGDYRVHVGSPTSSPALGRYEIRILAQRQATDTDKRHVAGQRLFEESEKLRDQGAATAKRQAIEKHQQAMAHFEAAGDKYRQALTARQIGFAYLQLNETRTALSYFDKALALAQILKEQNLEATTRNFTGGAYDILGDVRKAIEQYDLARELARETGNKSTEASALNNTGKIYNDLADGQKALDHYQQALPIFRALGFTSLEGITLNNIGVAYNLLGEPQKAIDYLLRALPLLQGSGDKNAVSYTLSNIGRGYRRLDNYPEALNYYKQAQAIQNETGNRGQQAETLDALGDVYFAQGQPDKALQYHQEALQIHRTTGNLRREAISLNQLGRVYTLLSQPDKALEHFAQALSILRAIGDLNNIAIALEGSARAQRAQGNLDEAQKRVEEALALIETVRTRSTSQQLRAAYLASMKRAYEFYIDLLMERHAKEPTSSYDAQALQVAERGRARSLLELLNEARIDIRQGVDADLTKRERALSQVLNAKAQRQIQLLARKGSKDEVEIVKREISALEDEYQQVLATIRKQSPNYSALIEPEPLSAKEIQQQLDPNTLLLEYSLGDERSYLWVVGSGVLRSYKLPKRDAIRKAALGFYELLTARSASKPGETPRQKQERLAEADAALMRAGQELSAIVLGPVGSELAGKRLVIVPDDALQYVPFSALPAFRASSAMLGRGARKLPNESKLEPAATIQYSAGGEKYRPLVLDHEIIKLPSASALAVHRQHLANRKLAPKAIAVIADPVFSINDDRLNAGTRSVKVKESMEPSSGTRILEHLAEDSTGKLAIRRLRFTRQEAEQIMTVAPRAANFKALDFKASRATATSSELSQYRYIHFATHGYLDSERADLSAVVLSLVDEQGNPQNGFLRVLDIYNLDLPAELIVLSACQTGLGKEIKGEGLVGLTHGFMYAGARRIVVSLWSVNDKATAELMRRFYHAMLIEKLTPAAALRKAQAQMARHPQWHSPYYWAAFVLQGEWR